MKSNTSSPRLLGFRLDPDNPRKISPQPVSEEMYFAIGRPIWRHQKRMQAQGKCALSDVYSLWMCDADCELCKFQCQGRSIALDREINDAEGNTIRMLDFLPADDPSPENVAVDMVILRKILDRLNTLDPDAVAIGHVMVEQNISQRKALEQLNLKRTTYRSQFEKAVRKICLEFGIESMDELF